jgi:biotin carboxylase
MSRPKLLLLASGDEEYRGYMLKRLAESYTISLLSPDPLTWERSHIADYALIAADDEPGIFRQADSLAARHRFAGVLTYHEPCVELAARIALHLGLPHCDPVAIGRCRDKLGSRVAFAEAGIPSARFALAKTAEEATKAAAALGWPVVVKPRSLSASFGVTLVHDPAVLETAFWRAYEMTLPEPWAHKRGVLIEEYLDGPEISVDSLVQGGLAKPAVYARKRLGPPPFFEEVGHVVGPAEQIVDEPEVIAELVVAAHTALGLDNVATHAEIRLTRDGPRMIEINGRTGGDLIPYLGELAVGVDVVSAAGRLAVGDSSVAAFPVRHQAAGVHFFYASSAGTVEHREVADPPKWLHQIRWLMPAGRRIDPEPGRLYFARLGYAIVEAGTVAECERRLNEVQVLGG